jgi:hypothetical protein
MVEGVILATGVHPIPKAYRHGQSVPVTLAFLDHNQNEISQIADLFVDRMWKPKRKSAPRKSGLYDRERIVPTRESVTSQDSSVTQAPGLDNKLTRNREANKERESELHITGG